MPIVTAATVVSTHPSYSPDVSAPPSESSVAPYWNPITRFAFRVCFVYFGLYVLLTQMLGSLVFIPRLGIPPLAAVTPFRQVFIWYGRHVLGMVKPFDLPLTGSGDRMFDWVQAATMLTIALLTAAVWTYLARDRAHHERLYRWFRVFVRLSLATTLFSYGFAKVVPLQMHNQLTRLVEPYGNFSMMGVLWASIGASPAYESFTGLAEIGAGMLLLIPQTARAGAFLALMDTIAVFMLNMTYDVPVKLFSFHLVLMSVFLIAPIALTTFDLFIRNRPARIPPEPPLGATRGARRAATTAQIVFTIYLLSFYVWGGYRAWYRTYGDGAERSPFYGIWDVHVMRVDGVERPPLLTDTLRFRRAIFEFPQSVTMQRMNDTFRRMSAVIDTTKHTIALSSGPALSIQRDTSKKTIFTYRRPDPAHLMLDGTMNGHWTQLELLYRNPNTFTQRSHGFNLLQEFPYNR